MSAATADNAVPADNPPRTVRVLPDVTGLDKTFDYLVPRELTAIIERIGVGAIVRADLHGRRVAGWVVAIDPTDAYSTAKLAPITSVTGHGPSPELVDLASWAAFRWVARPRHFLKAASPPRVIKDLPASRQTGRVIDPRSPASSSVLGEGGGVLRLPPTSDPMPAVMSAVALGPTLVVVPAADDASILAARLRRSGLTVALMPNDWALAAGGVDVVVGARAAAWAPCAGLAAVVVLDEHDEALQEEGSPTWHAREVLIERCRRAAVPLLLVSPIPTLTAQAWRTAVHPSTDRERRGWPSVEIIDRSDTEPWKRSLLTSPLIAQLRDDARTVVCVSNTTGRAKLLACRQCRTLTRCERCDAAVELTADERLVCRRCGTERPPVCLECGAGSFANLRPGIGQLQTELEAAAGRSVVLVQGGDAGPTPRAGVYVGTEAVLHRVDRADTVVFLDFDRELLAPRYRAGEQAMGLLVRAARLVGPRSHGGRVLVQTFLPRHEVLVAARLGQPERFARAERERRQLLRLPPYGAFAEVSGAGASEFMETVPVSASVQVAETDGVYALRSSSWDELSGALNTGVRPPGARLRIAVDPPRS